MGAIGKFFDKHPRGGTSTPRSPMQAQMAIASRSCWMTTAAKQSLFITIPGTGLVARPNRKLLTRRSDTSSDAYDDGKLRKE